MVATAAALASLGAKAGCAAAARTQKNWADSVRMTLSAVWRGRPAAAGDGGVELGAILIGEGEGVGEQLDRVAVGGTADAPLQGADRLDAEACPLGQLFLGEAGGEAQAAEQHAERRGGRWYIHL